MNLRPGSRIAIIAALPGELKPLVQMREQQGDWQRPEPNIWTGHIAGHDAIAIAGGIGSAAAARAVGHAFAEG
jgi:adenosylhomocysteine nucleosidase